jgi:hypothetical protein
VRAARIAAVAVVATAGLLPRTASADQLVCVRVDPARACVPDPLPSGVPEHQVDKVGAIVDWAGDLLP